MLSNAQSSDESGGSRSNGLALSQGDNSTQIVILDFDAHCPAFTMAGALGPLFGEFTSHQYMHKQRDVIQARIESNYSPFNIALTRVEPADDG